MSLNGKIHNLSSERKCGIRAPSERQLSRSHRLLGAGIEVGRYPPEGPGNTGEIKKPHNHLQYHTRLRCIGLIQFQ